MYGKYTADYSRISQIVEAMSELLSIAQINSILNAAEEGGFDAGVEALAQASSEIVKEHNAVNLQRAYDTGVIISLKDQVEMHKGFAEKAMNALNVPRAVQPPTRASHYQNVIRWGHVQPTPVYNLADAAGRPFPPMTSTQVLMTEDGLIDMGAHYRALSIARDLCRMGHWDGKEVIRIADPYGIYNALDQYVILSHEGGELTVRKALAPQAQGN